MEGPHCTSSTMSREEWRTKGTRARSGGVREEMPVPELREVPKSWVKRGVSWGDRMWRVYDIFFGFVLLFFFFFSLLLFFAFFLPL